MLSRVFLFSFQCGMNIPCVLLGMNEVSWLEIRGKMPVNIGQEGSGAGVGVAPAGAAAAVPAGPSSEGNTPHIIPVAVVSGASRIQVPLSGCSLCHSWNFFSSRLEGAVCPANTPGPQEMVFM